MAGVTISSLWARDADLVEAIQAQEAKRSHARGWRLCLLAFSALGVVYGDIGTSPLYVYGAVFPDGAPADTDVIYGVFSTIFWSITSIVLMKYIAFTLQADDNGEGGIFALYALLCRAANIRNGSQVHEADLSLSQYLTPDHQHQHPAAPPNGRMPWRKAVGKRAREALARSDAWQVLLLAVVLLAANLIISDGVLTPAISVVSAIEGIEFQTGISKSTVVGISVGILVGLFAMQSFGTQKVSGLFSPIVLLWFGVNAIIGAYNLNRHGTSAFKALSPHYMYYYWSGRAPEAWRGLGNILLCVTGAEALYADIGHFSVLSIRLSFLFVVYPSLVVTYLGQTAMVASNPAAAATAYWSSVPDAVLWPVVILATGAAIIASQALISGSFTIVQQAMAMSAFPRLTVRHTSEHNIGQVYIPEVNWLLMLGCIAVVAIFQTSSKIGHAYGLAVVSVMVLGTSLLALVMIMAWELHPLLVSAFWLLFTFITGAFFSSNVQKVPKGAWFSLALASLLSIITYTWHWGQHQKLRYIRDRRTLLRDMFESVPPAGTGSKGGSSAKGSLARASVTSTASGITSEKSGAQVLPSTQQALRLVGSQLPVARVPGIGIYYNELLIGVPPVLERFISLMPAIHSVVIFLTVRMVPVPTVMDTERLLLRRLRFPSFYHVVARYGYLEAVDNGPEFVWGVVQEIYEYLHPMTGVHDMAQGMQEMSVHGGTALGMEDSMHGGVEGGAQPVVAAASEAATADVEVGLARCSATYPPPGGLWRASTCRGVVRVDPAESVTAVSGRRMGSRLALQLVHLATSTAAINNDTLQSRASVGSRRSRPPSDVQRGSAITMAVPLDVEEAGVDRWPSSPGGDGQQGAVPPAAPWVQMPSMVRRVRAQLLGQVAPPPTEAAMQQLRRQLTSPALLRGDSAADDVVRSLPLPPSTARPLLPRTTHDSTVSLPAGTRPPALQEVQQRSAGNRGKQQLLMGADAAADAAGTAAVALAVPGVAASRQRPLRQGHAPAQMPATGTATLTPSAAAQLGQQLWQRLQVQRYLGEQRADGMRTVLEGETMHAGLDIVPGELRSSATADSTVAESVAATEDVMARELGGAGEARRQLFDVHASVVASQLQDLYAAERQALLRAQAEGVVYLVGRSALRCVPGTGWFKRFVVESLYASLVDNCHPSTSAYNVPRDNLLHVGVDYEV